jgi:hypothetical protein
LHPPKNHSKNWLIKDDFGNEAFVLNLINETFK